MTSILVVFESKYGQAQKIAEFIADLARRRGLLPRLVPVGAAAVIDPADHDAVIVVAPIYVGRHPRTIEQFLRRHVEVLSLVPTAFVSVSNSAGSADPNARADAKRLAKTFVDGVGARARLVATAGGAFAYPRYGFVLRLVMKLIARRTGGPKDTTRIHELTDWAKLEGDLVPFLAVVEANHRRAQRIDPPFGRVAKAPDQSGVFQMPGGRAMANLRAQSSMPPAARCDGFVSSARAQAARPSSKLAAAVPRSSSSHRVTESTARCIAFLRRSNQQGTQPLPGP
jgi:menaquinone-dependent protoporphyrinogen IX oxidase